MKNRILIVLAALAPWWIQAQASLTIGAGTIVRCEGNPQIVLHNASWFQNGQFSPGESTVLFTGSDSSVIIGGDHRSQFFDCILFRPGHNTIVKQRIEVGNYLMPADGALDLNGFQLSFSDPYAGLLPEDDYSRLTGPTGGLAVTEYAPSPGWAENPAGLGASIQFLGAAGRTRVIRGHQPLSLPSGPSAARWYAIEPSNPFAGDAVLRLHYLDAELLTTDETALQVWCSTDMGANWAELPLTARHTEQNWLKVSAGELPAIFAIGPGAAFAGLMAPQANAQQTADAAVAALRLVVNPVADNMIVEIFSPEEVPGASIEVYDANGRLALRFPVRLHKGENAFAFPAGELSTGFYAMRCNGISVAGIAMIKQ